MTEPNYKQQYIEDLRKRNFVILANEKYPAPRLYNASSRSALPKEFIELDYQRFLNKNEDENASAIVPYVMKSLPLVTGEVFQPKAEQLLYRDGTWWINTHRSYESSAHGEVSPLFIEYLARLFPNDEERKICIQWLAHIIQCPEIRPSWHLLLSSEAGTGKGFLFHQVMTPLLCKQTYLARSYAEITNQFSTALCDNLLILLDDPKSTSDSQMTKIKSALTETRVSIERKHLTAKMEPTFTRVLLASNEERPLLLDKDERRWFAPQRLKHKYDVAETERFLSKLADWLSKPLSIDALYHWFRKTDLADFNPKHVHQTPTLLEMIGASKNSLENIYVEYVSEKKVFALNDLVQHILDLGYSKPSNRDLSYNLNLRCSQKWLTPKGQRRTRYWVSKEVSDEEALDLLNLHTYCTDQAQTEHSGNPF